MEFVPEWAPNAHPMFVHFPIALLFTAVLIDFLALVIRPWRWLRPAAVTLYVVGAISAVVTYFTGQAAADSVMLPAQAQTVLTDHADLATWTVWFFGLYALVRLGAAGYRKTRRSLAVHVVLFLIGLAGLYLPWQTAEHGSMMVYRYGVGVQAAEIENPVQHDHSEHDAATEQGGSAAAKGPAAKGSASGPEIAANGSWEWTPGSQAAEALRSSFTWLTGEAAQLRPETQPAESQGEVLVLQAQGRPAMFVAGESLASIQADAALNLSGFDGTLMLVHHVQDAENYDFLALENGTMRQGRVRQGQTTVFDEGSFNQEGWLSARVVSDQTHFRGYAGGQMIVHGHGDAPEPGPVGLRIEGTGTVLLGRLDVQSLR